MTLEDISSNEENCREIPLEDIEDYAILTFEARRGNEFSAQLNRLRKKEKYGSSFKEIDLFLKAHISSCHLCRDAYHNFLREERSLESLSAFADLSPESELFWGKKNYDLLSRRFTVEHPEHQDATKLRVYLKLKAIVAMPSTSKGPTYSRVRERFRINPKYESHIEACEYCRAFLKSAINFFSQVM